MESQTFVPLAVAFRGRRCVCVGGGGVAGRRVPALVEAGAQVTVIAPALHPVLEQLSAVGAIAHVPLRYAIGDVAGAYFVLAATGIPEVDVTVAAEARQSGALVCVASDPALGDCHFMATVRRGALLVGIHTAGTAPAMSAALRGRIEAALPDNLEEILEQLGELRAELRAAVPDARERARRWQRVAQSGALDALLGGAGTAALDEVRAILMFLRDVGA